jgi:hypothetical protein
MASKCRLSSFTRLALILAVVIGVLTIIQAIRQDGWEPIWLIGWLPAVLVGVLAPPRRRRHGRHDRGGP